MSRSTRAVYAAAMDAGEDDFGQHGWAPEAAGGAQFFGGPAGGAAPPGEATAALLATTIYASARWNFPAAIGTPAGSPGGIGTPASLTFGFLSSAPAELPSLVNFQPMSAGQQAGMRAALNCWADVARIDFTEAPGMTADLRIGRSDQTSGGFAYFPAYGFSTNQGIITTVTANASAGDIFLSNSVSDVFPIGSNAFQLALHETGHALGLKHPFDGPVALPVATGSQRYTVMAYAAAPDAGTVRVTGSAIGGYSWTAFDVAPSTPMLYDIVAMQALYGANTASHAGDDTYRWADHERLLMTIWDGGGTDTIDASNQSLRCLISLVDGSFSSIGLRTTEAALRLDIPDFATAVPTPSYNGRDNLAIAYGAVIENALGGAGDDVLTGNPIANILDGGLGADTMAGGAGDDQYVVDDLADVVTENAGEGLDTAWVKAVMPVTLGPNVEIVRLYGAANAATGGNTATQLVANPILASTLQGGTGDDVLWGSALDNALRGGGGDDIIRAQGGGGIFAGGAGNDHYVVDRLDTLLVENAGEGIDTAWVTVDGYGVGPQVEITRLVGTATRVTGSDGDEQLVANPTAGSSVNGAGGDDVLWGSSFVDTLNGGAGDDMLRGQGGADLYIGELGNDHFAVLDAGVTITELPGQGYDTAWVAISGWTLPANIERANLSGDANSITGNAGDNFIVGNPTLGNAWLIGGAGNDTIYGSAFDDVFRGDAGNDHFFSEGGADRFVYQTSDFGSDSISGFTPGRAHIDLSGLGIGWGSVFVNPYWAVLTLVGISNSSIVVYGVSSLNEADFIF